MTEVPAEGLPDRSSSSSLLQDHQGRVWLGTMAGLGYLDNGRFIPVGGVAAGYIDAITQDREGNLWIAHRDEGLLRLSGDFKLQRIPWARFAQMPRARLAVDPAHGGLWIGFFSGALVHFVDGQVRESYSVRDGWGKGSINDVRVEADGTVWAASEGGLSRLKAGHIATLDTRSGLPCDFVHADERLPGRAAERVRAGRGRERHPAQAAAEPRHRRVARQCAGADWMTARASLAS